MSVEFENVYRRNKTNKLSVVTKMATRDAVCGIWRKKVKITCTAAAVGGDVDHMMILLRNRDNNSRPCSGKGG
jgi:hypothetical protein